MGKVRVLLSQLYIEAYGKRTKLVNDEKFNKTLFRIRTGKSADSFPSRIRTSWRV